jgi:hypothetical protein
VGRAAVDVPETHRNITTEFMSNKHLLPPDAAMVAARLIECVNCQRLPTTCLMVRRSEFFPLSGTLTRVTVTSTELRQLILSDPLDRDQRDVQDNESQLDHLDSSKHQAAAEGDHCC